MSDGEVVYEIRADDSKLDSDLQASENKVKKSSESTKDNAKKNKVAETEVVREENKNIVKNSEEAGQKVEKQADNSSSKISSSFKGAGVAIGASFLAVGAAAIGVGVAAVSSANDMDKAMNGFMASTGKASGETERYQGVLENIYANNYGDSFEDIANSMGLVTQQMGDLSDEELQKITESAYLLRDTFDMDISESILGANSMMKQFGVSGEEAYNLIAQGAQEGLNQNGDLADQVAEYSVYYSQLGLSAEDMMNGMARGIESGAYQVDYLNDAMKEFGIRSKDSSDTSKEAFEALGLNADEMTKKFADGGKGAKEAFKQVTDALVNVDDTMELNTIGVALFGTKFEDVGYDGIAALTGLDGAIDGSIDKLGEIESVKYDDLGSMFEGLKRSVELLLLPLGEMLIPILDKVLQTLMPIIEEALPPFIELIGGLLEQIFPLIEEALPPLLELFGGLFEQLMPLIQEILPIIIDLFEKLMPPIMQIIQALLPPLIDLISALLPIFQIVIDLLMPIIDLFLQLLGPIVSLITNALVPLVEALMPIVELIADLLIPVLSYLMDSFSDTFSVIVNIIIGAVDLISNNINTIKNVFSSIIDFIKNVFTGNWKGAWQNIKDIFSSILSGLGNAFKIPINFIIDGINSFIGGINEISIPDWVPGVGGMSMDIGMIPRLKKGKAFIPNDYFPAFLDYGERVLTQEQNAKFNVMGGIDGMEMALSGGIDSEGVTSNNNINADVSLSDDDINRLCGAIEKIETIIDMDGEKVGKILTPHVDKNLGDINTSKRRGG